MDVFSVRSLLQDYKRHGKSLGTVESQRTERMGTQWSTTEIRELSLVVQDLYNKVRE
jgi:hypothetical protein